MLYSPKWWWVNNGDVFAMGFESVKKKNTPKNPNNNKASSSQISDLHPGIGVHDAHIETAWDEDPTKPLETWTNWTKYAAVCSRKQQPRCAKQRISWVNLWGWQFKTNSRKLRLLLNQQPLDLKPEQMFPLKSINLMVFPTWKMIPQQNSNRYPWNIPGPLTIPFYEGNFGLNMTNLGYVPGVWTGIFWGNDFCSKMFSETFHQFPNFLR